ncbi:hypothetical protein KAFR_0B02410 [Kazachstania africana CBS 2517]|uniref:Rho-GAP domain-containing protein n=1 Tax=Kazachstania africana (strain ATCC 22294 / BCRC 22015 / CBS 2517 / CECT 1963 / NBRC 1671 / NRRL Y-8276) TaxID=1071382 RepID=H2AQ89_KAZAF|nr:hypothetical protein KAFR_0B02410 [Kazachstania africana CBS 2517]CCF56539.1 hypothetical protein KAFR_0B02410 [Kazachstania africana CBS 2517]
MKNFLWSSKHKKSSNLKTSSSPNSTGRDSYTVQKSSSRSSLSGSQSSSSSLSQYLHGTHHSSRNGRNLSLPLSNSNSHLPTENYNRRSTSKLPLRDHSNSPLTHTTSDVYLSDPNSKLTRSSLSTSRENSSLISEDIGSISSKNRSQSHDALSMHNSTIIQTDRSSPDQSRRSTLPDILSSMTLNDSAPNLARESTNSIQDTINLNDENYDSTVLKFGWINRSHGQIIAQNTMTSSASYQALRSDNKTNYRESRLYNSDLVTNNGSVPNDSAEMISSRNSLILDSQKIPDYRIYKAQLKGCVFNLYKSGLGNNVKSFDPQIPSDEIQKNDENSQEYQQRRTSTHSSLSNIDNYNNTNSDKKFTHNSKYELRYLNDKGPHPDLKLDQDGNILGGTIESLCHTVVFSRSAPSSHDEHQTQVDAAKEQRHIINLILILPLINHLVNFLVIFNHFGLTFTKHKSKLTSESLQYCNISSTSDNLMTDRLALVVKTLLDVLPGYLLDNEIFHATLQLLDTLSLHNDEVSNRLKISVADKHNELTKLTSFVNSRDTTTNADITDSILNVNNFLASNIKDIAEQVHNINLKFDKIWAPRFDYSLLYSSEFTNTKLIAMNPLVFNNNENVHYLGRLLISHLFDTSSDMNPRLRAKLLVKWVQLGSRFEHLGDMVSWLAIATIMCSVPILRLLSSWKHVPESTLKVIFRDWVPTIAQLDRRNMSSKPTSSVFILAPPNLDNSFIRSNVISYFGDLIIHTNNLPQETKFKYLQKKINRTKNAFHKWHQRLDAIDAEDNDVRAASQIRDINPETSNIYQFWKYHITRPPLTIQKLMDLSLKQEPPVIDQKAYSKIGFRRSALITGSYLPILFNTMLPSYSIFPQQSLIGAAGSSTSVKIVPPPRSSVRSSKSLPVSNPVMLSSTNPSIIDKNQITGVENIDDPLLKELELIPSSKQFLMKSIRDVFNIDTDVFHVSDDLIFKSNFVNDSKSSAASLVVESPKRFSQYSFNGASNKNIKSSRDSERFSKSLETMDFFKNIGTVPDSLQESFIQVVLKAASLDKMLDLLVLTANIFSKLVESKDLEKYYHNKRRRQGNSNSASHNVETTENNNVGLLDYAFLKLVMDNDNFTETFFNTYKSFTTTLPVLENLAKRFIGAKSCAAAISRILNNSDDDYANSASSELKFPIWDSKSSNASGVDLSSVVKIQLGAAEAILHLVLYHYIDFTEDAKCNSTFLDILKIMEKEISQEWPARIKELKKTSESSNENTNEIELLVDNLKETYEKTKINYQNQLYKPVGIGKTRRQIMELLESYKALPLVELGFQIEEGKILDPMVSRFKELKYDSYEEIIDWVCELDDLLARKTAMVSKQEWFSVYQVFELASTESLTSFFSYPLLSSSANMVNSNSFQLKDMEISNVFNWLFSLTIEGDSKKSFKPFQRLPSSVQLLVRLHSSLGTLFMFAATDFNKTYEERVKCCAKTLQILNYVRWKNSSIDLFASEEEDSSQICPHIPSFIETAICNAMVSPESRYFEHAWNAALNLLSNSPSTKVSNVLISIDNHHIRRFLELDNVFSTKTKNLSTCPGWFIGRLLEISQFVPNMSINNSKLINFDKRRFTNNLISNFLDLIPEATMHGDDKFGNVLFNDFEDVNKAYRKRIKIVAATEAKSIKFQGNGLFNELLALETEKVKRESSKLETLTIQEEDSRRVNQALSRDHRDSISIGANSSARLRSSNNDAGFSPSASSPSISLARANRGSVSAVSTKGSTVLNSGTTSGGVGKKLGGFFRRPFSVAGFNTSTSNYSLNAALNQDGKKSIDPKYLPEILINESKPVLSLKTFEIKNIVEIINHRKNPAYNYSFKIIMQNGQEHMFQTVGANDLYDWIKMIKTSKRYSFHSQKYRGKTHNKIFGVPLEDICEREGTIVPTIVVKLLEEIELRGLDEIGLYRIPGSVGSINALKNAFDEEGAVDNSFTLEDDRWFEINAIAGCFKMYLRELPNSLFSNKMVGDFTDVAMRLRSSELKYDDYNRELVALLNKLPACYYETMKRIVFHLNKVHQHVSNNRMDASNLAIVFSMSFIDQEDLASSMGQKLGAIQTILQHFIKSPGDFFAQ